MTSSSRIRGDWHRIDRAEGFRRALTTPLESTPGAGFRYSDINFILLGALVEKLTGEVEDDYVQQNVFAPLGMTETRYLPAAKACGPHSMRGAAIAWAPATAGSRRPIALLARGAPASCRASRRRHGTKKAERIRSKNPDIDYLLRGTVNDTTARRMGGVAGHAGVFSTAHDVGIYAQALLDRLAGRPSEYPLRQATLRVDDESAAART